MKQRMSKSNVIGYILFSLAYLTIHTSYCVQPGTSIWQMTANVASSTPTALTSSDVSNGVLTLSESKSYHVAEDLTATVTITANNVFLNLNNRKLTGRIVVDADNVFVKEGYIYASAPTDATDAAFGAIEITQQADKARVLDCYIVCADSDDASTTGENGLNGRSGITNKGANSKITECTVIGGAGGAGARGNSSNAG